MKNFVAIFISLFFLASCSNPDKSDNSKNSNKDSVQTTEQTTIGHSEKEDLLSRQWVLKERKGKKGKTYKAASPSIVLTLKISGYFSYADLIDLDGEGGEPEILENRSSGQWKLENDQLVMFYRTSDSTNRVDYQIQQLDSVNLVINNTAKGIIDTYVARTTK